MICFSTTRLLACLVFISSAFAAEKQIKLEDIEKDNLKSDHQAKLEKQYQQYQSPQGLHYQTPQGLQYQTPQGLHYQTPQGLQYQSPQGLQYQQPALAFPPSYSQQQPTPSPYSQYVLPYNAQQYLQQGLQQSLQQGLYQGNYAQLGSNSINGAFQSPNPMQSYSPYYSQQLHQVGHGGVGGGGSNPGNQQALLMAYAAASPSYAALQQQAAAYYQGFQQYMSQQGQQGPALYYQQQPEVTPTASASTAGPTPSPSALYHSQQYIPSFQSLSQSSRVPSSANPSPQYTFTSSQSPSPSPYTSSQALSQSIDSSAYLSALKQSAQTAASLGQQHQYLQAVGSTTSPLQSKYQNSPQYLAQNYNTIPSTHLLTKSAYSGVKPTASPILKVASQGGFIPNNPNGSSSGSHPVYRSISG